MNRQFLPVVEGVNFRRGIYAAVYQLCTLRRLSPVNRFVEWKIPATSDSHRRIERYASMKRAQRCSSRWGRGLKAISMQKSAMDLTTHSK